MGRIANACTPFVSAAIAVCAAFSVAACGGSSDTAGRVALNEAQAATAAAPPGEVQSQGETVLAPLSLRARAALDSGNVQMREKRYVAALASYRVAVKEAPGHTAPEYGVYMAAQRLGNAALADSALRIINAHTGGAAAWTDSAMRGAHGERALPKSHPKI